LSSVDRFVPYSIIAMLQDNLSIRHYQKVTDGMVDCWNRGHSYEEVRLYLDGYIACLRQTNTIESYLVHRLEEEAFNFLRDPSNFEPPVLTQRDIY
jgi:hypothetical protein